MSIKWLKAAVWFQVVFAAMACCRAAAATNADPAQAAATVNKYWAAEVKQDYGTLWDLLGPIQQLADTRDEYIKVRTEKGPLRILAADVKAVEVAGNLAWADVKYDYVVANFPGYPTRTVERWQQWRYTDRWYPLASTEVGDWPALPPKLRDTADEAALQKRVEGMWKARVAEDMKGIYEYMSPAFKAAVPVEQFTKIKGKLRYVSAKVEWVEARESQAKARVSYATKENEEAMSKMKPIENAGVEPWIKVDGQWYIDSLVPDVPAAQAEPAKQAASSKEGTK